MTPGELSRVRKRLFVEDPDRGPAFNEAVRRRKEAYDAEVQQRKEKVVAENADEIARVNKMVEECAKATSARKGWLWDLAGAAAGRFPDARVDGRDWLSWAAWSTAAKNWDNASLVLLARFERHKTAGTWDGYGDVGVRGIVAQQSYAASVEAIARQHLQNVADGEQVWYYRVAVTADYMVMDGSWLSVSVGKSFGSGDAGSLFTLANLKWGFGKPTVTLPPPAVNVKKNAAATGGASPGASDDDE
jgi:hypothetical protein